MLCISIKVWRVTRICICICILFLLHPIIHQLYNNTIVVQSIIIINNNINNTIVVQYQLAQSCLNYLYIIMITKEEN